RQLDDALKTSPAARISRPVEMSVQILAVVFGPVTEIAAIVEFWRAHDLAGIEQPFRIKHVLHSFERANQPRPEHLLVEFRADQPVPVLARVRAFVGAHELKSLLGNGPHCLDVILEAQVQHRPYVEAPYRCVRVPGAARAVLLVTIGGVGGLLMMTYA